MELEGKVAIVTGGSRGIGKQICLTFAREGAAVVVVARTEKEGQSRLPGTIHQTVDEIRAFGGKAIPIRTDITVDEDVERMVQRAMEEFGQIDILVNNAAANINSTIADLPIKRWDLMMRVNLRGTFICTKAGIELFCWGLAQEFKEYNIAVNDLYSTGGVITDGFKKVFERHTFSEEAMKAMKTPDQIAKAALWIARQDASTFTGRSMNDDEVRVFSESEPSFDVVPDN